MSITWKYVKELEDKKSVKSFLNQHGVVLPKELVNIIETYNGGRPSEKDLKTDHDREYVFKSLLSYNQNDKEVIYNFYPELFIEKLNMFPIGTDAAGNFVCFNTKENVFYLVNHESGEEEKIVEMLWYGEDL